MSPLQAPAQLERAPRASVKVVLDLGLGPKANGRSLKGRAAISCDSFKIGPNSRDHRRPGISVFESLLPLPLTGWVRHDIARDGRAGADPRRSPAVS